MRPNDASFPALLIVEALADAALDTAIAALRTTIRMRAPLVRYDQAFALDRDEVVQARAP